MFREATYLTVISNSLNKIIRTKWKEKFPDFTIYRELEGKEDPFLPTEEKERKERKGLPSLKQCEKALLDFPPKTAIEREFSKKNLSGFTANGLETLLGRKTDK